MTEHAPQPELRAAPFHLFWGILVRLSKRRLNTGVDEFPYRYNFNLESGAKIFNAVEGLPLKDHPAFLHP
jgi:hypothetical protein